MKPVIVHDSAKAEIRNALEKYDQIRADLAADFRRILDSADCAFGPFDEGATVLLRGGGVGGVGAGLGAGG